MSTVEATTPGVPEGIVRGLRCRCPACGKGRLFGRFLKVVDRCETCGTDMHHHRADDLPPYLVIFIVGHIVGWGVYISEMRLEAPLSLALIQPVKGAVVGLQFALGMHGFGTAREESGREQG
jgi:uncharacterized protein (DUF983 family)